MTKSATACDVIILGAGGAGLMCGAVAGARGRRVAILDHADAPGKKILISGGGRCNFTNTGAAPQNFLSDNPHFAKSALGRYRPADFIALVERYKIAWHEKTLGQLFCDGSARQIVDMLLAECANADVSLNLGQSIRDVTHADGQFTVTTTTHSYTAPSLVIATGGPSIPKMGATGFAYELAEKFGLDVVTPRPALVPLTLAKTDALFQSLSGVSADVAARFGRAAFREAALFTHRGLSGPAILQVSSYWHCGQPISVDFAPDAPAGWLHAAKREKPRTHLRSALADIVADRLAAALVDRLIAEIEADDGRVGGALADMPDKLLAHLEQRIAHWVFRPNGTEGYAKAEVTAGGIATHELSSRTMEAKRTPGLFCIGEAVDVTGWLGGYNFQWAWASGVAAGEVA